VRKELGELLGWFHESERLARAVVEAGCDPGEILGAGSNAVRQRLPWMGRLDVVVMGVPSVSCRERLASGEPVDLRPELGKRVDASDEKGWDSGRTVEASMLSALLTVAVGAEGWTHRPLRLAGARITGALDLESATLTRPLHLEDCFLEDPVRLNDAQASTIWLTGCHLPGIVGGALHTRGDLRLNDGFTATGEVDLPGAHIGGTLDCSGGTFTNPSGTALYADSLTVDGNMFCRAGFTATGAVDLGGARIGGQLDCSGGTFTNETRTALDANRLTVDGNMFWRAGFTATGEANLRGAHIGGQLDCSGGTFTNENRTALDADSLTVDGHMLCTGGFTATGGVYLMGAHIGGALFCDGGTFANEKGFALGLYKAEVGKEVVFFPTSLTGEVDLSFATVGGWRDAEATWPDKGKLRLNGFTYPVIDATPQVTVRRRLQWLQLDAEGFQPQPYDQLARAYRLQGDDGAARTVQITAQWRRRAAAAAAKGWPGRVLRPLRLLWSTLLWATIGYGYRPWQILAPIAILYGFGCWWFTQAAHHGAILRANNLAPQVHFNGARYTADLLIPGASLGERAHFLATGPTAWWAAGYTLAGWALAAMLIAGLTGVFKRQ
jgi:hypothetical protein